MDSFNDVKINVRSLLTSSQKPLSIQELQKDYYDQEGENIPYKRFGFNSTIELLQSMNDVLTLPSNPSLSSLVSLVVGDKTSHLRMLVVKQKSNTKKKKKSVLSERTNRHKSYTNYNGNSSFPGNNISITKSQNSENYIRSNIFYSKHTNERNQQTISNVRRHSDYNQNNSNQNGSHRTGYLTNELRSYIEKYISENQMVITINKFKEIVKNHPDFGAMNATSIQDVRHLVKDFLNINETEVSLKKAQQFGTNESILITNHDTAGALNKNPNFPNIVLLNIARILSVYCDGLSIKNFKLIYCILYHTDIDPSTYGFTSMMQMFKKLDHIVEIQKNILYISPKYKFEFSHLKNINYEEKNDGALLTNNLDISLFVDQLIFPLINDFSKTEMVLVEMYDPSVFYLQLADKVMELEHLKKQMHQFYDEENSNYNVLPHMYIVPGSIFASCYTTFLNVKQWHRVRVLREINSEIVKVIHVDYGTVDTMPKTELRFLYKEFGKLPCQAIHCCLTGYNKLEKLSPKVSDAFLEIINNKPVMVEIDNSYNLNEQCQILHVTLYQHESNNSDTLKNINNELTLWHL